MKKLSSRSSLVFFAACFWAFVVLSFPAQSLGESGNWQTEWEKTKELAEKEGKLVYHSGNSVEPYFVEFGKRFPKIKPIRMLTRGGSAAHQRLMAERRARVYASDIVHLGKGSGGRLARAKALDPIEPYMILPEVLDQSKWFEGKHHYVDQDRKSLFKYASNPGVDVTYNTKLVNPKEIRSYWDLLDDKWKGKIVVYHPRARGSRLFSYFYYLPELGRPFLKRLFAEMDVTASRERRQMIDWLAKGNFAFALRTAPGASTADRARAQGLPVDWFIPTHFKEPVGISAGPAHIAVVNRAPHPNAAKFFINWFLSREGQLAVQKIAAQGSEGVDSLRIDIPKDMVPVDYRRGDKTRFFDMDTPERSDERPVLKYISEVWKRR